MASVSRRKTLAQTEIISYPFLLFDSFGAVNVDHSDFSALKALVLQRMIARL